MNLKNLNILKIVFGALGILAVYLESLMFLKNGVLLGLGLLGIAGIFWGTEEIIKRQGGYFSADPTNSRAETFRGIAAAMSGMALIIAGAALISAAVLGLAGFGEIAFIYLKARPGILLCFLGVLGFTFSLKQIIGPMGVKGNFWSVLVSIPARLFGILLLLISIALMLAGFLDIVLPEIFQQVYQAILHRFIPPGLLG